MILNITKKGIRFSLHCRHLGFIPQCLIGRLGLILEIQNIQIRIFRSQESDRLVHPRHVKVVTHITVLFGGFILLHGRDTSRLKISLVLLLKFRADPSYLGPSGISVLKVRIVPTPQQVEFSTNGANQAHEASQDMQIKIG